MSRPLLSDSATGWKDVLLLFVSLLVGYFLIELLNTVYLSYKPKRIQVNDAPYSAFDPDTGFTLLPGNKRCLSFYKGKLLWKITLRPNNLGYNSGYDYEAPKPSPKTKRFIILGDSFTAGENMNVTWADKFNELLQPLGGQAYGFAKPAIGLDNWHGIFFKQIVPTFEFDALIIACYHNDLSRFFTIFHTKDNVTYYTRTKTPPSNEEDFRKTLLPKMVPLFSNTNPETVDRILAGSASVEGYTWKWAGYKLRLGRAALAFLFPGTESRTTLYEHFYQDPPVLSLEQIANSDPEFYQLTKLWDILNWCKDHDKPVILCSIPDIERLTPYVESQGKFLSENQRNLTNIAQHYGVRYFDGYAVYLGNSIDSIHHNYWSQEELHWDQAGAHLFAQRLFEMVRNDWSKLFPTP